MASYPPVEVSGPHAVLLHVYDVTNAASPAINATVSGLNRLTKDVLGLGGVFHGGASVVFLVSSFSLDLDPRRKKITQK